MSEHLLSLLHLSLLYLYLRKILKIKGMPPSSIFWEWLWTQFLILEKEGFQLPTSEFLYNSLIQHSRSLAFINTVYHWTLLPFFMQISSLREKKEKIRLTRSKLAQIWAKKRARHGALACKRKKIERRQNGYQTNFISWWIEYTVYGLK